MCFFRTTFYIKNVDWIHNPVTFNLNPPSNWSFDLKYDWFWCLHQVIAATFPDHYSLKPPEGTIFPTGVKKLCINLKSTYMLSLTKGDHDELLAISWSLYRNQLLTLQSLPVCYTGHLSLQTNTHFNLHSIC